VTDTNRKRYKVTDVKLNSATLELLQIIEDHNDFSYTGKRELKRRVLEWTADWLSLITSEQSIVNQGVLSSDALDQIKYHALGLMADDISKDCAIFNLSKNKISATILGVRRRKKDATP
jgi:uncharacterized protein YfkK (UPF0435 family)